METDKTLKDLLSTYENPKTSWDFEDKVMHKITETEKKNEKVQSKSLKLAWLFFGIGLVSGSLITSLRLSPNELILNVPIEEFMFPFQIGMVFFLLLFFNELYRSTIRKKSN